VNCFERGAVPLSPFSSFQGKEEKKEEEEPSNALLQLNYYYYNANCNSRYIWLYNESTATATKKIVVLCALMKFLPTKLDVPCDNNI